MRIGGQPLQTQITTNKEMQKVANQEVKTDDNIVKTTDGNLQQADLEGAINNATNDKIYIQTEDGSDQFLEIDLSKPENKQIIDSLLTDIKNGNPVQLDAQMLSMVEVPNTFVDPNPEINLKDGENTLKELETMGIDISDGISADEGQLIIEKLRIEGASGTEVEKIEDQIDKKLGRKEDIDLKFNKSSGTYSFDFKEQTHKIKDFSWSGKKSILHHGGRQKKQGWNLPTLKGMGQIVALPFVATGKAIGRLFGGPRVKCPSFGKRIDTWNFNPKIRTPQWTSIPKYEHTKGSTGPKQEEKIDNFSFKIDLTKITIPEPYEFDFPNLYQNNKTAIEDPEKFKKATQEDNNIFAKIVDEDKDLKITIKADGSRNKDRSDWSDHYSKAELQEQRAIKGSYDNENNTFMIHGTASAAPGSGEYREIDVPPFARDMVEPGVDKVHNDTLALFRSINAYIEFVNNADPDTQAAVKDKKVSFELHPKVEEHLKKVAPDLLAELKGGLSFNEMTTLPGSGIKDGFNKIYNENGDLESMGTFKDGELVDGKKYIYDDQDLLLEIHNYKDGEFTGTGTLEY